MSKIKYDKEVFVENFKTIIADSFNEDAINANFVIKPDYDPTKSESGEDSVFRMVILSDENVGNKKLSFEDTVDVLTMFSPHFPTRVSVSKESEKEDTTTFILNCSTRVRKPSAIANIECKYAPFILEKSK